MLQSRSAFSLIEILVGILIVSAIMIAAFQTLSAVGIAKVKLVEQTEIEKQAYFSSERFFELIKKGGTLDYEEYWNRYSYNRDFLNGHFEEISGFGNQGTVYNCVSGVGASNAMGTGGCLSNAVGFRNDLNVDFTNDHQRYGQYELQFIDRNSDGDNDGGDENADGDITGDDDDLFLGIGPAAFSGTTHTNKVGELYLISHDGRERTYFRWNVRDESTSSFAPTGATCDLSNPEFPSGTGCQGNIEMLKLVGADYGYNHTLGGAGDPDSDGSQGDGTIDTWLIHPDYASGNPNIIAGSDTINYWQPIFPSSINITDFEIYAYPNKDLNLSWRDADQSILVAPYIQIRYSIEPSLQVKAKIRGKAPSVDIATSISLSNLDIK